MITIKSLRKFKIFKSDAAPFFFYIEVFPPDLTAFKSEHFKNLLESINSNPIMPIPMRVDRVFNGVNSLLIRPREPISFSIMDNLIATVNPTAFIQKGFEKLLYFTEIRAFEKFLIHLTIEKVKNWWDSTKFLYAKLMYLEEDFSAISRAYIYTVLKAKLNNEDLISAAINYCNIVRDICEKRLKENSILIETRRKETNVKLYKQKIVKYIKKRKKVEELQYHPELVDIDVYDLSKRGFKNNIVSQNLIIEELKPNEIKYLPLLFYDDLLECMLQNLKILDEEDKEILDPSLLLDQNIIILKESKELEDFKTQNYSWFSTFEDIDLEKIVQSIESTLHQFFKEKGYYNKGISFL
ncbi:MAG: hypothetical protein ACFE75_14030 [Candidatus Hodarchaeota archaeon]